jgi:hypothetical protein
MNNRGGSLSTNRTVLESFFDIKDEDFSAVYTHKNVENVIRYYLLFLPPRGSDSILDIGCGISAPYRGVLQTRTKNYATVDLRPGPRVQYVMDVCNMKDFRDSEWHWGWCAETIEHVPPEMKEIATKEIMRVCRNCVFTYPTPLHDTFLADPGHTEVMIDWKKEFGETHYITDKSTKTGRSIIIIEQKDELNRMTFEHIYKKKKK